MLEQQDEKEQASLDPQRQQKAREYARIRRRLMLVDLALGGAFALAWLLSGASVWLRNQTVSVTDGQGFVVALYVVVLGVIYGILDGPLSTYSGFVLPHRYGLSTQSSTAWK